MKKILALLLCLSLFGCATIKVDYGKLTNVQYSPKSEGGEIILLTDKPERPYKEIGIITIEGKRKTSLDEINEAFIKKAREVGADAIINIKYGQSDRGFVFIPFGTGAFARAYSKTAQGTAIVFTK